MTRHVVLLSIPGLRAADLAAMPRLARWSPAQPNRRLVPSFPGVTCPVQANMTTGTPPREHGVVANGFYWRDKRRSRNVDRLERLHRAAADLGPAARARPGRSRRPCGFRCTARAAGPTMSARPAPIHNPDGSESLWCYTRPERAVRRAARRAGPLSAAALLGADGEHQVDRLDRRLGRRRGGRLAPQLLLHLSAAPRLRGPKDRPRQRRGHAGAGRAGREHRPAGRRVRRGLRRSRPLWLVASEYAITPVDHVAYPNRVLREAGLLAIDERHDGEHAGLRRQPRLGAGRSSVLARLRDRRRSAAVRSAWPSLFRGPAGHRRGAGRATATPLRSGPCRVRGEVVLVSTPNSWQAYYWWLDDARAPAFARTVDIHRKPGYDPVELHFDLATKSIPLDATLVKGSHGAPAASTGQRGVAASSHTHVLPRGGLRDIDIAGIVLRQFESQKLA